MSIAGILLGLINIAIVVAILLLAGLLVEWMLNLIAGIAIPQAIRKIYLLIVALIAVYLIVALLLGTAPLHFPFRAGFDGGPFAALPVATSRHHGA